jgi:hypothetical protein
MNVAYQFVVWVVEISERHKQKCGAEYLKPKNTNHKLATRLDHDEHELNKTTENENCCSKDYRIAESVTFCFFGGAWYQDNNEAKTHDNTSWAI